MRQKIIIITIFFILGFLAAKYHSHLTDNQLIDWVQIKGNGEIKDFKIMKTEATVRLYKECIKDGKCLPTEDADRCNAKHPDRLEHPINCLTWSMANDFCLWSKGTLPTAKQWEYAASNQGEKVDYPWGNKEPKCSLAVIDDGSPECLPKRTTKPVCSRPLGNTKQGLCDIVGNVYEWNSDYIIERNKNNAVFRSLRGGGIQSDGQFKITRELYHDQNWTYRGVGVRCITN